MSYLGRFPLTFRVYAIDFFRREAVNVGPFMEVSIYPLLFEDVLRTKFQILVWNHTGCLKGILERTIAEWFRRKATHIDDAV